jgi:hypothetical protein
MAHDDDSNSLTFDGRHWEDLVRLLTQATLEFMSDTNRYDDDDTPQLNERNKCAWLCKHFRGAALDWVGAASELNPAVFDDYDGFSDAAKQAFGVSTEGLAAHRRGQLEALKWQSHLPTFFAEYDRLTMQLHLTGDATKIAILRGKLPVHVQKLLAEQALDFANYDTMRERLLTMWALDPNRNTAVHAGGSSTSKRPKCGRCGKKGHTASDCRAAKN